MLVTRNVNLISVQSWTSDVIIHQIFWSKCVTWLNICQLKLGNIREYSPIACVAKKIWRTIKTISSIWGKNMLGYLSLDIICFFHSRKTVHFSKQIMSADKYLSIFSHQMATIIYIITCKMRLSAGTSDISYSTTWIC